MSIHIIDDEPSITEMLSNLLSRHSDQRLCFESAEEYLLYMHSDDYIEPEIIITDIMMGGMNGFDLIKEIRKHHTAVKIIIMSGYYHQHTAVEQNFDAFIAKPFNINAFITTVSRLYQPPQQKRNHLS